MNMGFSMWKTTRPDLTDQSHFPAPDIWALRSYARHRLGEQGPPNSRAGLALRLVHVKNWSRRAAYYSRTTSVPKCLLEYKKKSWSS